MAASNGVQFNVGGRALLQATFHALPPFVILHLIKSTTPPKQTDTYPYPWSEVTNPSYVPLTIPSDSITLSSDSTGSTGVIGPFSFPFAPYLAPQVTVNGWWIDYTQQATPVPLWGGAINPPYPIPLAGGLLAVDSITLTQHDCSPSLTLPGVIWFDPFIDVAGTQMPPHLPLVGSTYTFSQGTFVVGHGKATDAANANGDTVLFDPGVANGRFEIVMSALWPSVGNAARPAFLFRRSNATNYWQVVFEPDLSVVIVQKIVAGVATTMLSHTTGNVSPDACQVELILNGSSIDFLLNSADVGTVVDGFNSTATQCGLSIVAVGVGGAAVWSNLLIASS